MAPRRGHERWGGRQKKDNLGPGSLVDTYDPKALPYVSEIIAKENGRRKRNVADKKIAVRVAASNLPSLSVEARLKILKEYDPIDFLGHVMRGDEINGEIASLELRVTAARVLANKVVPDLKSVEQHVSPVTDVGDYLTMSDVELITILRTHNAGSSQGSTSLTDEEGSERKVDPLHHIHDAEFQDSPVSPDDSGEVGESSSR